MHNTIRPVNGRVLCTPDCSQVQSSHPDTKEKCEKHPHPSPPPLCGCVGWVKWLKPKRLSSKQRAQPHSGCATAPAGSPTPNTVGAGGRPWFRVVRTRTLPALFPTITRPEIKHNEQHFQPAATCQNSSCLTQGCTPEFVKGPVFYSPDSKTTYSPFPIADDSLLRAHNIL
jgi:hypothetical protein